MRRMFLSILAVGIVMMLIISLIMTFVPEGDTLTTRRYSSGKGYGFDYPRDWIKIASGDENDTPYSAYGYFIDCVFSQGLLSQKSLAVYISETETPRADFEPMTKELVELYESAGYDIRSTGYARFGGRIYNEISYTVNGRNVSEYMLSYAGHSFSFVFSSTDTNDVSDILSSVFFAHDSVSEAA